KLERVAHQGAEAYCNGTKLQFNSREYDFCSNETDWEEFAQEITEGVKRIFGTVPAGFRVNGDARGYALKIDPDDNRELIDSTRMYRDFGGYGILSPEITGD